MKIGVWTSGMENLILFKFLQRYDFNFVIFWDWDWRPIGDKGKERLLHRVKIALEAWPNVFWIVPPMAEVVLAKDYQNVVPLWQQYLMEEVLPYSVVGRLGFA